MGFVTSPCSSYSVAACAFTYVFFFFQAEDGIRDLTVTGVQTCALPILAVFIRDLRLEQIGRCGDHAVAQLLERRDVDDPEGAAVRRGDQLALARMNLEDRKSVV